MNNRPTSRSIRPARFLVLLILAGQLFAQTATPVLKALSRPESELVKGIKAETVREITTALSASDMEGRGTMQPGGEKAANWIAERFSKIGLKPLGEKGTFLQKVEFRESLYTAETGLRVGDEALKFGTDYAFLPYSKDDKNASGEMVFVGYGIRSKELGRDDTAGVRLEGKVVVMIDGPPANISKESWEKADAKFAIIGNMLRGGAAALIFIGHGREKDPPEMLIDYLSRRQLSLASESGLSLPIPPILIASGGAAAKFFAKSGVPLKDALAGAERNDFKAINLNQIAKVSSRTRTAKGTSSNVVGYIQGSDPKLREEAIVFSAHYDAYGTENGKTYFGAADNALGTAEMIAVAEAFSKGSLKPRRSLIFLAVTGEEYGLFGSKHWAKNPTWDIRKIAANLNLDGIGSEVYGPVKTVVGYGAEHSTIGAQLFDLAAVMGLDVIPDPVPEEKVFYRSDHYSFVERGIPAIMLLGAPAGDKNVWLKRIEQWEKTDYHQPGDVIQSNWSWEGAKTVSEIMAVLGYRISESDEMPAWLATSRFAGLERGNLKDLPAEN